MSNKQTSAQTIFEITSLNRPQFLPKMNSEDFDSSPKLTPASCRPPHSRNLSFPSTNQPTSPKCRTPIFEHHRGHQLTVDHRIQPKQVLALHQQSRLEGNRKFAAQKIVNHKYLCWFFDHPETTQAAHKCYTFCTIVIAHKDYRNSQGIKS